MEKKWFYLGNMGVLAVGDQIDQLKDYCKSRPDDLTKFEQVPFHALRDMINEAKEFVKADTESVKDEKPKRKRRTNVQIEADKASK